MSLFDDYRTSETEASQDVRTLSEEENVDRGRTFKHRLLSGGMWGFVGRAATVLIGFVSNALLARLLSPQDLGTYFLALSIVTLGAVIGSLGLNQAGVRFLAASMGLSQFRRARGVVRLVIALGLLGALGIGTTYALLGGLVGRVFESPALVAVSGLIAGWAAVATVQGLLSEIFRGLHDIRLATVFGSLTSGNGLVPGVLLIACLVSMWWVRGEASLALVMFLAAGSGLASALMAGWFLRRKVSVITSEGAGGKITAREMLQVAWPLLLTNLTLFALAQADVWILSAFRSQEEVAVYGAAARLVALVTIPLLVSNTFVPPLIAEMHAQGKREELERMLRTTATLSGIPAFLAFAIFVLASEPLLDLVFGDYYGAGASILVLLGVGQVARVWCGACGTTLMMSGHQRTMMLVTLASGLAAVAVGFYTVDRYGGLGVAAATALGNVLQSVLSWLMVKRATGMWTHASLTTLCGFVRAAKAS